MKKQNPEYMLFYRCTSCTMDFACTETSQAGQCPYCNEKGTMDLISKKLITPELIAERLKTLSSRMFSNLQSAYETMPELENNSGEDDFEKQILLLLEKAKQVKELIGDLELKEPDGESTIQD